MMKVISEFFQGNMDIISFISGLSFFLLGTAVLFQIRKGSEFRIGKYMWLIAMFGLLHGLNEWMDMSLMLQVENSDLHVKLTEIARFFVGKTSYIFLFMYGIIILCENLRRAFLLPGIFLGIFTAVIFSFLVWGFKADFNLKWFLISDASIRYALVFPGAILTASVFALELRSLEIEQLDSTSAKWGITGMGVVFLLYSFFEGLVVNPAGFLPASVLNADTFMKFTGLPVQIPRALCAVLMVVFICMVLNAFQRVMEFRLQAAYREILRISSWEQMQVGQDLNLELKDQLSGITLKSGTLGESLQTESYAKAKKVSAEVMDMLETCSETVKSLSRSLCPVSIEGDDLYVALERLASDTEKKSDVTCSMDLEPDLKIGSDENAVQLFRIVQESINNAIQHGQAQNISVSMVKEGKTVTLAVVDDGTGITEEEIEQSGMGLKIMNYRAGVFGGEVHVAPGEDGGTEVICTFRTPA